MKPRPPKPPLGDTYREEDETSPLPAFIGLAALILMACAAFHYFTKS